MKNLMTTAVLLFGLAGFAFGSTLTPEISPSSAAGAIALLSGALLVLRGRRRK